jgi:disulfide bond formation protein DsbB
MHAFIKFLRHPPLFTLPLLMFLGSAGPLGFALISQYAFYYPPCHFCMLQRYPYALILLVLLPFTFLGATLGAAKRDWVRAQGLFALLAWLTTASFAFYHVGIERGWVNYQGECVSHVEAGATAEDLKAAITNAPLVSCEEPSWEFLGLSMAFWNGVTGLTLAAMMFYLLAHTRRSTP